MKCPICGDEFTPKRADAKTCGKASCRKRLQRQARKQTAVGVSVSGSESGESRLKNANGKDAIRPSKDTSPLASKSEQQPTTKNPDQWYIDYYEGKTDQKVVLDDELYNRKCYICSKPFKTHLELQKFCSLECRNQFLSPV